MTSSMANSTPASRHTSASSRRNSPAPGLRVGALHALYHDQRQGVRLGTDEVEGGRMPVGQQGDQRVQGAGHAVAHGQLARRVGAGCSGRRPTCRSRGRRGRRPRTERSGRVRRKRAPRGSRTWWLRAGVAEHHPLGTWARLVQQRGELHLRGGVNAEHPAELGAVLDGRFDLGVAVAEHVQPEAHRRIEIAVAVGIPDVRAFAPVNEDGVRHLQVGGEPRVQNLRPLAGDGVRARRPGGEFGAGLGDRRHFPASLATTGANGPMASSPTVT
jgi:hypothetical protein